MNRFDDIAKRFPGAGTLVKGIQIMEFLAEAGRPTTSAELLRQTQLPKATLYRLLGALIDFGYVRRDARLKTYSLGQRLIELGGSSLATIDLRSAAESELTRLASEINETVSLTMLDGDRSIYVDVRRSSNPLSVGIEIGKSLHAVESTSGQAILAALPPHRVNGILAALSREEQSQLMADFAISRARGYTIGPSRTIEGVIVIAVPVIGPPDMGSGAIVVTALADHTPLERRHVIGRDLMEAARRIVGNLGSASVSITPNPRPSRHVSETLRCVARVGAIVGEGPVWDASAGVLRWVDIAAPAIHCYDPATGENRMDPCPHLVSAVLPAEDGRMVAISQNGLEALDVATGALRPLYDPEAHLSTNRFNDAKTDSRGRIWAGSMSLDASMPSGSLYCFDTLRSARAVDGGFQISNGLGWSPDDTRFYFVDSALGTVFVYDFDVETGTVANREAFLTFEPEEGKPDGMCVDSAGNVWVAMWDGWRVGCYDPSGDLIRTVDMPVPRPSSCYLGDDDLKTLYITSASIRLPASVLEEAPLSGSLFAIDVDVPGLPTNEVRGCP
ncbi:SMP-30/gluconolactonase/LRE family protein [Bauldia sp.]|uniref:SMP-30/gluconolactonase/LRE family protein n=1 Tax=Bauldia sp. TaxID=2575872 RepID=UPI003BAB46E4